MLPSTGNFYLILYLRPIISSENLLSYRLISRLVKAGIESGASLGQPSSLIVKTKVKTVAKFCNRGLKQLTEQEENRNNNSSDFEVKQE